MGVTVIVSLNVEDFDKWHTAFSSMSSKREEVGLHAKAHRNIDDKNNAIVIGTAPSKEVFLGMFTSPETQELQKNAGVLGPPEVKFVEEA
jgi:hypothetical protein